MNRTFVMIVAASVALMAVASYAKQGRYPQRGIRKPGTITAVAAPSTPTGTSCTFGSATFPCDF